MEIILYYIVECRDMLISFLILMFVIGIGCFILMSNFSQEKRGKILFYGLFFHMNTVDVLKMSSMLVKSFLAIYATIAIEQEKIFISLIIMFLLTMLYIVLAPKRFVYEIVTTAVNAGFIYFIYLINNYSIEVENSLIILMINISFILFVLVFTTYLFFREIDIITVDREIKNIKKEEKERKKQIKAEG